MAGACVRMLRVVGIGVCADDRSPVVHFCDLLLLFPVSFYLLRYYRWDLAIFSSLTT